MNKKITTLVLCVLLLTLSVPTAGQQSKKVSRIGYFSRVDAASDSARDEGIRLALRELGYVEGQNIVTDYRYANEKRDRFQELAAELLRLKVDLIIVAGGGGGLRQAMNATKTIPIVMTGGGADPVEAGLVESLARPGGNVTGVTLPGLKLGGKRLELIKETVPKAARIAFLYDPASGSETVREARRISPL
jgi:ABC-type uncharacterized transport system substrate-binding protein